MKKIKNVENLIENNLFSRSKSREPAGIVPETIPHNTMMFETLTDSKLKIFKEDTEPKYTKHERKTSIKRIKEQIRMNQPQDFNRGTEYSGKFQKHLTLINKNIDKKHNTISGHKNLFESAVCPTDKKVDNFNLVNYKSLYASSDKSGVMTKRKRFLELCYEVQERYAGIEQLKKHCTLSRELKDRCTAIRSINKADLYDKVMRDNIPEKEWFKFLSDVYSRPYDWT